MFALRRFHNLRVAAKLAVLLMPFIAVFISLSVWNYYSNGVVDKINQQVDDAYQMRGDVMTSALIASHYGAAVENQIPDTIRLKREDLKKILGGMNRGSDWDAKLDNAALATQQTEFVRQLERILGLEARAGQGMLEEAELLGDIATAFNQTLDAHIDNLSRYRLKQRNDLEIWSVAVLAAGALVSVTLGFWVARSIIRPLHRAVEVASAVAKGDLTQRIEVTSRDEVGRLLQALKDMNESLAGIVGEVRVTTESITTASQQIAAGSSDLSQRTEEQASNLEETASSMEELTSTVRQNAENAREANQLAANASDIAAKGGQAVGEVVQTMTRISASSGRIMDIIGVIESIAFQTNILALNAAVEAARAGEQGKGFAVVAGEVRNLAQRSAAAAKEIKTLIDDSVGNVYAGTKQVDQAGATMTEIVQAIKRVTDIIAEIAAASNEQSAGIGQVNQAIIQMDEVTQQNAALVEEAAAAAEAMQEQAQVLMHAVSIFKLEAGTTQATGVKPAARHAAALAIVHAPAAASAKGYTQNSQGQGSREWGLKRVLVSSGD